MNLFNDYEDIIGKPKTAHLENNMYDFFKLYDSIRSQLVKQGYLINKYVYDLLNSIRAVISFDSGADNDYGTGNLRQIILGIIEGKGDYKKYPIYEKAKEYIDEHPLPYQEEYTKVEIYYIALIDDFLEYTFKGFFDARKDTIRFNIDIVESRNLYRKISTLLGGEEKMERLNLLIRQRFMFVPSMTAFLQGLTEDLLYALTLWDIETGQTVLQLWGITNKN